MIVLFKNVRLKQKHILINKLMGDNGLYFFDFRCKQSKKGG